MKPYYNSSEGQIYHGDSLEVLKTMPDESIHCCITSPPYWGLRDYGIDGQLGLEKTPELYVEKMVEIFREVRRVLRSDGTLWLNLGDSYTSGNRKGRRSDKKNPARGMDYRPPPRGMDYRPPPEGLKPKDLCGIPWRVALALQSDGWYLRSDIIWHKPNPMPESVTDRPTQSHEYLFLMSKSARYYYDADAVKEDGAEYEIERRKREYAKGLNTTHKIADAPGQSPQSNGGGVKNLKHRQELIIKGKRNKRTVWTIPTKPFPKAHFATFPPHLIEPCILAGTSEKGCCYECGAPWGRVVEKTKTFQSGSGKSGNPIVGKQNLKASKTNSTPDVRMGPVVNSKTIGWQPTCNCDAETTLCTILDPFSGAMTTAITAYKHNRKFVMIELSESYIDDIGIPRIKKATDQLRLF